MVEQPRQSSLGGQPDHVLLPPKEEQRFSAFLGHVCGRQTPHQSGFLSVRETLPPGLLLALRWSKALQFRDRTVVCQLPWLGNHPLCPVRRFWEHSGESRYYTGMDQPCGTRQWGAGGPYCMVPFWAGSSPCSAKQGWTH